jgi:hypothetical protein
MQSPAAMQPDGSTQELDASLAPDADGDALLLTPRQDMLKAAHMDRRGEFFGVPDWPLRKELATADIAHVERGYGGRSVGFKITFTDGTRAYFKPEQTFSAAHWYAEVAAYYLDRELGLGRVAPSVGRRLLWKRLVPSVHNLASTHGTGDAGDDRLHEVIVGDDGYVRGVMTYWIPQKLIPLRTGKGWEKWIRIHGWPARSISPFQRPKVFVDAISAKRGIAPSDAVRSVLRSEDGEDEPAHAHAPDTTHAAAALPSPTDPTTTAPSADATPKHEYVASQPDVPDRPAELSDMIVFDYLTSNMDRWGGENTNVRIRGEGGALLFFDNAAGFTPHQPRNGLLQARLRAVEKFRRSTIEAIRNLDVQSLKQRMATDPLAPLLEDDAFEHLALRKQDILDHVGAMQAKYGDQVFAW